MKTITKRIILIYSYLFFSLLFYDFSFAFSDPEREIIVYISPEFIDFPDSTDNGFLLSSSGISSSNLYNLLDTSGIVNISRTFPSYTKADTILTDSFGREFNISLFSRVYTILLSSSDSIEVLIDRLYQLYDEVIFAERNIVSVTTGSDPEFDKQWYLRNTGQGSGTKGEDIKIESVWRIATGGPITIGLIDAGVQLDHPDLASRVSGDSYFWDVNGNPAENITTNHGTQMAGIIGAITNNAYNIKGINWISPINSYRVYKNGSVDVRCYFY
ncbi:MAG: S8 family serine peptidase [Ignavibacteria bacterium]|nr:S8 family serine peptidase [Ignavibacteria bacterium]